MDSFLTRANADREPPQCAPRVGDASNRCAFCPSRRALSGREPLENVERLESVQSVESTVESPRASASVRPGARATTSPTTSPPFPRTAATSHSPPPTNLVPGDTNGLDDGFLFDRQTGTTTRLTVGPGGVEAQGIPLFPTLSADGRYIAFPSDATNLVAGDTNGVTDMFRHDLVTQTTERVSVSTAGTQASGISDSPNWAFLSADGRFASRRRPRRGPGGVDDERVAAERRELTAAAVSPARGPGLSSTRINGPMRRPAGRRTACRRGAEPTERSCSRRRGTC